MNRVDQTEISEELLEQAALHLTLLDERAMTDTERDAFKAWLSQSDEHRRAFEQVASVWGKMDVLRGLADIFPIEGASAPAQPKRQGLLRGGLHWRGALAASILGLSVLGAYNLASWRDAGDAPGITAGNYAAEIRTHIGQVETLDMADGSRVVANTNSRLSIAMDNNQRRIVLDQGEAFFQVEHDPGRPFDVVVGETLVRAVGTAFSVYRNNGDIKVIVTEGIVEVISRGAASARDGTEQQERELLRPGQVAEYSAEGAKIQTVERQDLARKLAWRQGMLAFEGEPLEQVIEEFSRYNQVRLEIASDEIRDIRVGGYFNSSDVAGMLNALEGNFGVRVTYLGPDHVRLTAMR